MRDEMVLDAHEGMVLVMWMWGGKWQYGIRLSGGGMRHIGEEKYIRRVWKEKKRIVFAYIDERSGVKVYKRV